jgi:hypothetical protein
MTFEKRMTKMIRTGTVTDKVLACAILLEGCASNMWATPLVVKLLRHKEACVRVVAFECLSMIEGSVVFYTEAAELLKRGETDPTIRFEAKQALDRMREYAGV